VRVTATNVVRETPSVASKANDTTAPNICTAPNANLKASLRTVGGRRVIRIGGYHWPKKISSGNNRRAIGAFWRARSQRPTQAHPESSWPDTPEACGGIFPALASGCRSSMSAPDARAPDPLSAGTRGAATPSAAAVSGSRPDRTRTTRVPARAEGFSAGLDLRTLGTSGPPSFAAQTAFA
jgi:hypothetical protein